MNPNFKSKPDILIVDDHLIFRQGLKAIINFENVGSVVGEASNGEEFLEILTALNPDLVLMDVDMPQMDGFEATKKALDILPDLKIIAFTVFSEEEYCTQMKEIGAKGFILKSSGFSELENAIKIVMKGGHYFTHNLLKGNGIDFKQIEMTNEPEKVDDSRGKNGKMLFFPWTAN